MYPAALGSNLYWGFTPDMHLTEDDPLATPQNRYQLYAEWRRYWNTSKPILLEKSPRHMLMTRLLQYWFSTERSFFVVVLRHPLANIKSQWSNADVDDCGESWMKRWLDVQEAMFRDLKYIRNHVAFYFEKLNSVQRYQSLKFVDRKSVV